MQSKFILASLSNKSMTKHKLKESMQIRSIYSFNKSSNLDSLLSTSSVLKQKIDSKQPLVDSNLRSAIQQKLKCVWTYHSNAIEGSTLSLGDTIFFLQEGITVSGKPFKDFLDAKNHAEAVEYLYEVIADERPINEYLIKNINSILLTGTDSTPAITPSGEQVRKKANPGQYKSLPNHVLQMDGTIHHYIEPHEMHDLMEYINKNMKIEHPIITSSIAHYNMVRIHPFDDGNGRGARILMNLILLKEHYPPAIIRYENRKRYLESLNRADRGEINPFIELVAESAIQTQEVILDEIEKAVIKEDKKIMGDPESTNTFNR